MTRKRSGFEPGKAAAKTVQITCFLAPLDDWINEWDHLIAEALRNGKEALEDMLVQYDLEEALIAHPASASYTPSSSRTPIGIELKALAIELFYPG